MNDTPTLSENLSRLQRLAFLVGAVGMALLGIGWLTDRDRLYQAWLMGYVYWLGPALGSLAIVMLHNMTSGGWGFAIKRLLEAAMRTLPWMVLLFVPVLLGMHHLYEWTDAKLVASDPVLQFKSAYLNVPFFVARAAFYFALWIGFSRWLLGLADRYDKTISIQSLRRIKRISGFGLALYVITLSFASFDWSMSIEPHWFSTIYGLQYVVGQGLSTLALAVVVASRLARHEPFKRWLEPGHFHDLGNLLMAFTMLWAYLAFSQFLLIWSGNLPEETTWYLRRIGHGWQAVAILLVLAHFAVPFLVLLQRRVKRDFRLLSAVAVGIFLVRYLDYFWMIKPAFLHAHVSDAGVVSYPGFALSWMDVVAPIAIGGLWVGLFVRGLRGRPLVSLQDARLLGQLEEAPVQ